MPIPALDPTVTTVGIEVFSGPYATICCWTFHGLIVRFLHWYVENVSKVVY